MPTEPRLAGDITDEELAEIERTHPSPPYVLIPRLIAALRACRELRGAAVEAMRLCMKDLQEYGVIFAPGDPPYDVLVSYDQETG